MGLAGMLFYAIWKIDQEKNKGFDSSFTQVFHSLFGSSNTLETYLTLHEKHGPPVMIPDDWGFFRIVFDHFKNYATMSGNWESLYSKVFRIAAKPGKSLLPPTRDSDSMRTLVVDLDTVIHSTWSRKTEYERLQRPGWKKFLRRMAICGWEVVIFW
eukprot:UN26802